MLRSLRRYLFGSNDSTPTDAVATAEPPQGAPLASAPPLTRPDAAPSPVAAPDTEPGWWTPRGAPVIVPASAEGRLKAVDGQLYQELSRAFDASEVELPQLPEVARRVLELLDREDVNFGEAAGVAEQDPVLTAEILRTVNCVSFRGIQRVERLSLAFPRLGVRRLRAMLVGATMKSLAIRPGAAGNSLGAQLWRCASASAVIASETAKRLKLAEDEAYLAGLLHDIGQLVLLRVLHDYQQKSGAKITRPLYDSLVERWHERLGLRLADAWQLPDPLPELIANHHRPPGEGDPLAPQRLLLNFADVCCAMMEFAPYVPYDFFNLPCVSRLGLGDTPDTRAFLRELQETVQERVEGV